MSRYTLHARSGLLIDGLLLLPAAPVVAEGEADVPTVKIEPQLRARSHASEATIEAVRQATVAAQVQGRVLEARVDAGARVRQGDVLLRIDTREADQPLPPRRPTSRRPRRGWWMPARPSIAHAQPAGAQLHQRGRPRPGPGGL